jgi:hypothetical protein
MKEMYYLVNCEMWVKALAVAFRPAGCPDPEENEMRLDTQYVGGPDASSKSQIPRV